MIRLCNRKFLLKALFWSVASPSLFAGTISIDFEGLSDSTFVTTQYADLTFSNTIILTSGISLNELDFPPRSGSNVASDSGGPVSLIFSTPALDFLSYFTYTVPVTLRGFDSFNNLLASSVSLFSNSTATGGDPGSMPNELLALSSATGFSKITITGDPAGSSFTFDDPAYTTGQTVISPEPSSLVLAGFAIALLARKAIRRRSTC